MRKFLAGLFAFAFILGFSANTLGWALLEAVFTPRTYMSIIRQPDFADSAADLLRGEVAGQIGAQGGVGALLSADDVDWAAQRLVTGSWLAAQMERWLTVLFDWTESDEPAPELTLSLAELKQEAFSVVESLLTEKLNALPACEPGFILRALEAILSGNSVPLCLPPGVDVKSLLESDALNLRGEVNAYLASVPDEIDALALLAPAARSRLLSALNDLRAARQRAVSALTALGVGLLALFLLIGLLCRKPWRSLFQWWGWTLFLAGGLALSAFGLAYAGRTTIWTWIVTSPNGALPAALSPLVKTVFMGVLAPVWKSVLFTGGVAAAVGLFLALLAFALPSGRGVSSQVQR